MAWLPTDRAEVVQVAWPEALSVCVVHPVMLVAPSLNVTVPVGVPAPGAAALTVAVKVLPWQKTDGLAEDDTAVVVAAWLTVWVSADEVLPVKVVLPP